MSYPNISISNVLNYICAISEEKPFGGARYFANKLYYFSRENGYIRRYDPYTTFFLSFLDALTGDGAVSTECQNAINHYFAGVDLSKYNNASPACKCMIRTGTAKFKKAYTAALERTAETRQLLSKSCLISFDQEENARFVDYIKYVKNFEPEQDAAVFYSALYNIGFIQGIRAERARHSHKPVSNSERLTVSAYRGNKHRNRYYHQKTE